MRRFFESKALACAALLLAAGCGGARGEGGRDYTLRAQVAQAPDPANPAAGLYLYHEAIDDWVSRDGKVEGMDPMTMPFPVAPGIPLTGLAAGDKVEVTLHADWSADTAIQITRIRELPAGTRLDFRAARPPGKT
jgi:Cu/Ag efflux protein CusF